MDKLLTPPVKQNLLIRVISDPTYVAVRRIGRFSIERAAAASPMHLASAICEMQEAMIAGLMRKGMEYLGERFKLAGPLDHIAFSDEAQADPGPQSRPDPRDADATARFERAERQRLARKAGEVGPDLVDYTLTTAFKKRIHDMQTVKWQPARR